jgi:hypothetical protein
MTTVAYLALRQASASADRNAIIALMCLIGEVHALQTNGSKDTTSGDEVGVKELLSRVATLHGLQNFFEYVL